MKIKDLVQDAWQHAEDKGFHSLPGSDNPGERLMLIVCELAEVMEEIRDGHPLNEIYYAHGKPEGVPIELADVFIRLADFCGQHDVPIETALKTKAAFNKTRPFRHGGKVA